MASENDFLPFATDVGANVLSQGDYEAAAFVGTGFEAGIAQAEQLNKAWRQASVIASQFAQLIADRTADHVADDGDLATLLTQFIAGLATTGDAHGQCYLAYVSTVLIRLSPSNGARLKVNGKSQLIPAAGISAANTAVRLNGVNAQNLAASTRYNVFVNSAGVIEFWGAVLATGGHMPDTTAGNIGVEVRNNNGVVDSTLTYLGFVVTTGASLFQAQGLGTASWFNPRLVALVGPNSTGGTASVDPVEMNAASRQSFVCHAIHATRVTLNGYSSNSAPGGPSNSAVGMDVFNTPWIATAFQQVLAGGPSDAATVGSAVLTEGAHIASPLTWVGAVGGATVISAAVLVEVMA